MKKQIVAAALAAFFMLPLLGTTAYAGGGDYYGEPSIPVEEATPIPATEEPTVPEEETKPFTPAGTATVIDNATDADGKEFYTIMTPEENVFYLVIDKQREQQNVYFLNAVTEADLLALAELPTAPEPVVVEQPPVQPEPEPTPEPEKGGGTGMILFMIVVVLIGGGAGWYFKIYRPKQQAGAREDYDDGESDPYGEDAAPWPGDEDAPPDTGDDLPPWDDEDEDE